MTSRVFTCELDDTLLAACVYFLEENGAVVQGRTASHIVTVSLQALATFLHEEKLLPEGGVPHPTEYVNSRLGDALSEHPSSSLKESLQQVLRVTGAMEKPSISADLISDATDYKIPDTIPEPQEVLPEDELPAPVVDLSHPPWEGLDIIPFDDLKHMSPKDMLVERIIENENPLLQKAVEVVYAIYPPQNWGTEACMKLISGTIEKFKPYEELLIHDRDDT